MDFHIARGEVVGFLGPNGAGKTTTLRMLCGYLAPTAGTVELNGVDVTRDRRAAQRHLGYLPESTPLYGEMRVHEYLDFRARLYGLGRRQRRDAVGRAAERCGLAGVGRRPIHQLSKGYRQRVGLAAALVHEPPVLILDEPTSGLDPTQVREVRALIRELAGRHTLLLSTHHLSEVELTCGRIIMLAGGRVRADGTIDELRGGADRYVVECDLAAAEEALQGLADVEAVDAAALEGRWHRLTVDARPGAGDLREAIARAVTDRGATVRELRREVQGLERLFVRLAEGHEVGGPPSGPPAAGRQERAIA